MVTIALGVRDLANVRFAFSPLWECVAAFRIWCDPVRDAVHLPWTVAADRSARRAGVRGTDWTLLETVACAPSRVLPDFLAPPPTTPLARFGDELAAVRRTPAAVVRREARAAYPNGAPAHLAQALRDPDAFLGELTRLLELFWAYAVAPSWPRVVARLEAEILFRSRALALGGAPALFAALHPTVRFVARGGGGVLLIRAREGYRRVARGAGVLLVPSVFAWPHVFVAARPPWRPTLAYPARGVADLWSPPPSDRGVAAVSAAPALATLVGAQRARVLTRLITPHTTIELARALRRSPAAMSAQVTALWRAGVADRTRVGRRVYYALNSRGRALLAAVEPTVASAEWVR